MARSADQPARSTAGRPADDPPGREEVADALRRLEEVERTGARRSDWRSRGVSDHDQVVGGGCRAGRRAARSPCTPATREGVCGGLGWGRVKNSTVKRTGLFGGAVRRARSAGRCALVSPLPSGGRPTTAASLAAGSQRVHGVLGRVGGLARPPRPTPGRGDERGVAAVNVPIASLQPQGRTLGRPPQEAEPASRACRSIGDHRTARASRED